MMAAQCLLGSKPTLGPQLGSKKVQHIDTNTTSCGQARKQRHTTVDTQIVEKRVGEMNGTGCQGTPEEIVASKQTSCVLGVHQWQVKEDTLDNQEDTNSCDNDTDTRDDPVDIRVTRPSEDEEANGHEKGNEQGGDEAALRATETVKPDAGLDAVVDVPPVPCYADDDADGDGQECQAHFAEVEVVHCVVDEGEGFEEGVEDSVHDGSVDGGEGDAGVQQHEFKGAPESFGGDGPGSEVCLVDFRLALELVVAGEAAEALGAAEEDGCRGGLWEEEEEGQEDGSVHPEHFPERPAPVLGCDAEATDDGAEGWAAGCSEGPEGEDVGELDQAVDVLEGGAASSQAGTSKEAL